MTKEVTAELRVLRSAEWDEWYDVLVRAFGWVAESSEERSLWRELNEFERSVGAWDGGACVGTAGAFRFRVTVPGGALVPAAGVTMVSVAPTHRRRGVLRAMMRRQLDDVRAWGEPLAVLTASEPEIYGRFGYGIATRQMTAEVDTDRIRLTVPPGTDSLRLRLADPAAVLEACEAVYAAAVPLRPGMVARNPGWGRLTLLDPSSERGGASPVQCVVAEDGGEVVGYARYAIKPEFDAAGPKGTVVLRDMCAPDPAVYAALWQFLFGIDLTSTVKLRSAPVDDPLLHLVSDIRRCRIGIRDALHVRLVDVGAALEARSYATRADVVLEVTDSFCPWNEGRWRLTADAKDGSVCRRTDGPADLALSVRELGAAYLGGTTLSELAAAGRVRELRQGALREASVAFASDIAPWLPHGF
ncbi:GNAT family N-acetyltransferase [Streptomyces sp. NPDC047108]|uniref:GNAT family N-acetyltransferase n=1 Tax=Streptomyces sp. NPDC047108 TaxID=3155025 RepID=UPI0033E7EDE6